MASLAGEKRKNGERRVFPWWLLVVGFAAGVLFTLGLQLGRGGTVSVYSAESIPDTFALTATQIINEATARAQAQNFAVPADPIQLTATAFIQQATQQAALPSSASGELDPLLATATAFIQQATRQAASSSGS